MTESNDKPPDHRATQAGECAPPVADSDDSCATCGHPPPGARPVPDRDGRLAGEWEPRYSEGDAAKRIKQEAWYVGLSFVLYLSLIALVSYGTVREVWRIDPNLVEPVAPALLAYLGGSLGGTLFDMKWLYHSVAKNQWNADRRLWRVFTPALSGGGAMCIILLSSAQVLPLFGSDVVNTRSGALGIGIVLGYFSDRVFSALEGFAKQSIPNAQAPEDQTDHTKPKRS